MNLRQAYLEMIRAFPGGWDAMAASLGLSRDALENRVYERRGQAISVELAQQMQKNSGKPLFAEAIAAMSGGVFTKLMDPSSVDREELHAKFQELWARLGDLSRTFTAYTDDNHIDPRERNELERISNEIHKTMRELMALMFQIYCESSGEDSSGGEVSAA